MLRGIFTGHIGTKPITQEALEAEARGDFSQALKLYNEVSEGGERRRHLTGEARHSESKLKIDYWYQSLFLRFIVALFAHLLECNSFEVVITLIIINNN